jgi:hypothetical protein
VIDLPVVDALFFQSELEILGHIRDLLMPPSSKLGFIGREMVRTMAGTKTGILSGSMETRMPVARARALP